MHNQPDILKKIIDQKLKDVRSRSKAVSLQEISRKSENAPKIRPFLKSLHKSIMVNGAGVICEIKKASPSRGVIQENFDPSAIAQSYALGGATALSVLTDQPFFQGSDSDLQVARKSCHLPVLRKDFMLTPYQIYEARVLGADCVLLIVAALSDSTLMELFQLAHTLNMDVLVEVHDCAELERALSLNPQLLGINNRNLRTFETQLNTTLELLPKVPKSTLVVTESGINTREDIQMMCDNGVHAFLVGEALMRTENPGGQLRHLFEGKLSPQKPSAL